MAERMIDTSRWQGSCSALPLPNYGQVVAEDVKYMAIKATQGYSIDRSFTYALNESVRLGIKWGGYHYWTKEDNSRSAKGFAILTKGSPMPPIVDFEPDGTVAVIWGKQLKPFLDEVEFVAGRRPWIYTGAGYWNRFFPKVPEWIGNYKLWMAAYPYKKTTWTPATQWDPNQYTYLKPTLPIGWNELQLVAWQFTDSGSIPGVTGKIDLDWIYTEKL